jgi:hypothetical protein
MRARQFLRQRRASAILIKIKLIDVASKDKNSSAERGAWFDEAKGDNVRAIFQPYLGMQSM